jgi:hypothetical protein
VKRLKESTGDIRRRLNAYKNEKKCMDCEIEYPYYVLDFDHVRGNKIENVSNMAKYYTWDEILKEIKKCELVCSNCHRIRTHKRQSGIINKSKGA